MQKNLSLLVSGLCAFNLALMSARAAFAGGDLPTPDMIAGRWAMQTRTAPFEMNLSVDATYHVTGSFTAAPGFVNAGTLRGRLVGEYVVFTLTQSNGARGDGVLQYLWYPSAGAFVLLGPVKLDDDLRPIDNWSGTKIVYKLNPRILTTPPK